MHGGLGLRVQVGRGFVEHNDVRRLQYEAGQGDSLLLATREPVAALADHRVEAVGQLADDVADLRLGEAEIDLRLVRHGDDVAVHVLRRLGDIEVVITA